LKKGTTLHALKPMSTTTPQPAATADCAVLLGGCVVPLQAALRLNQGAGAVKKHLKPNCSNTIWGCAGVQAVV
jgi:hypothetical protein